MHEVAGDIGIAFVVDARDLLIPFRDDADLFRRGTIAILDEPVDPDAGRLQLVAQPFGCRVDANQADERRAPAERHDVVRHVRRAPQPQMLGLELHDGDRRFRRDAGDAPDDEAIEHHVTDDEDGETGEPAHEIARPIRVERRQHHEVGSRKSEVRRWRREAASDFILRKPPAA